MPPPDAPALQKLLLFFWYNSVFFLKLALVKGAVFIAFAKPHFSKAHNLFILLTVYPCYLLAYQTLRNCKLQPIVFTLFSIIGLQTLMIMFTVEDWDCRFTAPILPFLFILGALGLKEALQARFPVWDRVDTQRN
ncbi:hypothetical protein ACFSC6_21820 [Rufibacter sediminis]|uniref:Uncharacterized protein n=1 Tax=Rufibacter sediminis TaxID=2762756 RepID=A0ABR6VUB3_9BACT|nr:hypothetical protein [Rufibacter sediminis]MBC3540778.1 hypothetical protein [Rufibacter sediminis]